MTMLDIEFKGVVAAYLKGSGMSDRRLGELALDDLGFVADLNRDHSPRLDTADRVLQFLGMAPIGPRFRREIEAFLTITRCKPAALGTKAAGDSSFVRELRRGASPALASVDRVRSWMRRFASESDRTAIAWLLAHDDTPTPSGLHAVFASWTDATAVQKLDETLSIPSYFLQDGEHSLVQPVFGQQCGEFVEQRSQSLRWPVGNMFIKHVPLAK